MSSVEISKSFKACQGSIELFALEGRYAVELLASNPLAGFCLAVNWVFHKPVVLWPMAAARHYMTKPQREILAWLGFKPVNEAVAKIGRKCVPQSLTIDRCTDFRRALAHAHARHLLAHLPRINAGVMEIVSDIEIYPLASPELLMEVAQCNSEDEMVESAPVMADIRRMHRMIYRDAIMPAAQSKAALRRLHDRLVLEVNQRGIRVVGRGGFPPPPVPGVADAGTIITPITSVDELCALARAQHNCVASYSRMIRAGNTYIYRVTVNGKICTLCLKRSRQGGWFIAEIRANCNKAAPDQVIKAVHEWLRKAHQGALVLPDATDQPDRLPPPPFVGMKQDGLEILPLVETSMLDACGAAVVRFRRDIIAGRAAAYRVVTPTDRGVSIIVRGQRGKWHIEANHGEERTSIKGETLLAVNDWLSRVQGRFR